MTTDEFNPTANTLSLIRREWQAAALIDAFRRVETELLNEAQYGMQEEAFHRVLALLNGMIEELI